MLRRFSLILGGVPLPPTNDRKREHAPQNDTDPKSVSDTAERTANHRAKCTAYQDTRHGNPKIRRDDRCAIAMGH